TDQVRLQSHFIQSQKIESIGVLAGGIAHDFNNLLMIIRGFTEDVMLSVEDEELRRSLSHVLKASDRGAELTRKLLAFGRKQLLRMAPCELSSLVSSALELVSRLLPEDVQLVVHAEEHLPVIGDCIQIEQVITNIVINARDAMPAGGVLTVDTDRVFISEEEKIALDLQEGGEFAVVTIADTGTGIAAEDLERIFEPFYTTKAFGSSSGLGLSTSYGIVKQHRGTMAVASVKGQGTRFSIYLPLAALPQEAREPEEVPHEAGRVLVVEDEEGVREFVRSLLTAKGYDVTCAADGVEGLNRYRQPDGSFDLVVTDVVMPRMTGPEMAEAILRADPSARILYMSGYSAEILDMKGVPETVDVLYKPVPPKELLKKIRKMIPRSGG
ncbi:MAG TPA: ATP-binding protein, partial [Verrucomicrobiae bacterium]|nr:ATP-binding protein [Verrucomicrobiae bacterium]